MNTLIGIGTDIKNVKNGNAFDKLRLKNLSTIMHNIMLNLELVEESKSQRVEESKHQVILPTNV
jgi:hypothetical protein